MKDFIVRLASMKLAEMKFEVEFGTQDTYNSEHFTERKSIKTIKESIKSFFYPVDKLVIDASINNDIRQGYWAVEIFQFIEKNDQYLEVIIYKPDDMPLDLFRKIMRSAGLNDGRKIAQLVKGRKK